MISKHPSKPFKIIGDKGYQCDSEDYIITPYKGDALSLTTSQNAFNEKLGKTRIIIENYFGRLKQRFQIMYEKYRGDKKDYAEVFTLCCALLNFEIVECGHTLRDSDKRFYDRFKAMMVLDKEKNEKALKKKKKQQAESRMKKYEIEISDED